MLEAGRTRGVGSSVSVRIGNKLNETFFSVQQYHSTVLRTRASESIVVQAELRPE